jgi:hypothetical protein
MSRLVCAVTVAVFALMSRPGVAQQSATPATGVIRLQFDEGFFNPGRKKVLSYRDGEMAMKLLNEEKNLTVSIENRAAQTSGKIDLPPEIVQVNEIRAGQKNKAVVVGMVNGSVFEVVVLDTRSISIADSFLAYCPAISPDGRFIAFVKFYPAHFVDGTDDHYLLYDLALTAGENRSANLGISDHADVGVPIWPTVANRSGDNTGVPQPQQHHMTAQAFFWRSDSERYAFADEHGGDLDLIIVSPSHGPPDVSKVAISRAEMCAALHTETCQLTLAEADLTQTGVLATFRGVGADSSLQQLVQFRYQQLSPVR